MTTINELRDVTAIAIKDDDDTLRENSEHLEEAILREAMAQAELGYHFCHFRPGDRSIQIEIVDRTKELLRSQGFFVCDQHEYQHGGGIWVSWYESEWEEEGEIYEA